MPISIGETMLDIEVMAGLCPKATIDRVFQPVGPSEAGSTISTPC